MKYGVETKVMPVKKGIFYLQSISPTDFIKKRPSGSALQSAFTAFAQAYETLQRPEALSLGFKVRKDWPKRKSGARPVLPALS